MLQTSIQGSDAKTQPDYLNCDRIYASTPGGSGLVFLTWLWWICVTEEPLPGHFQYFMPSSKVSVLLIWKDRSTANMNFRVEPLFRKRNFYLLCCKISVSCLCRVWVPTKTFSLICCAVFQNIITTDLEGSTQKESSSSMNGAV